MKRPSGLLHWARVSVFWRFAIVLLIILMALLLFPQATEVRTDSLHAMTVGTLSREFGILLGFLRVEESSTGGRCSLAVSAVSSCVPV